MSLAGRVDSLATAVGQRIKTVETALAGKQPLDGELSALAALVSAADKLPYFTGSGSAALADLTAYARTILDDGNATAARTTLDVYSKAEAQALGVQSGVMTSQKISSTVTPTANQTQTSTTAGMITGLAATIVGEGRPVRVIVELGGITRASGTATFVYVNLFQDSTLVTFRAAKGLDTTTPGGPLAFSWTSAILTSGVSYQFRVGTHQPTASQTFNIVAAATIPSEITVCRG